MKEKKLDEIEFPVIFRTCIYPSVNVTELENVGYKSIWYYFTGREEYFADKENKPHDHECLGSHCPATSIVKIFMPIEVIHLILTARKNGFGKVVSDNLLMEGKFSYFNFNVLQCKKLAYFCKF